MRKIYLVDLFDLFASDLASSRLKSDEKDMTKTIEEFESETHTTKKETWVSQDGTYRYTRTYSEPKARVDVGELESRLKKAVEIEDYETAAVLRDEIRKHKKKEA